MIENNSNSIQMNVSQFEKQLISVYTSLINKEIPFKMFPSVMLWGPPGVGKSQGIRYIASALEEKTGKRVVDTICNISTNGRCIFFNANFISKLHPSELDFILCHQIMHIINGDIWRGQELKNEDYHRACDIYNNAQLINIGWRISSFSHLGKLQYQIPASGKDISDLNAYDIYNLLPYRLSILDERTRRRYMTDSDFYWDFKQWDYLDGIVILDIPKMTKYVDELENSSDDEYGGINGSGKGEDLKCFWINHIEQAASITKGMGKKAGTLPRGIKREIDKNKERVVNWKKILDDFVQEEITDYSFTPPDRRYGEAEYFLPDFNERDYNPKDILFMADTSGSVCKEDLSKVYEEIGSAIEQFNGKLNGRLGFFDQEVTEPIPFQSVEDVLSIIPYGGGGTSFEVIFEYIREHIEEFTPAMIVIFTDGYADFPKQEDAMNIPVLWLINNEQVTPSWGKVGRVV